MFQDKGSRFSHLLKGIVIASNISSVGPVTIASIPYSIFDRETLENLSMRGILSSGMDKNNYYDRMFSARLILPDIDDQVYEALIYSFVTREDDPERTLILNSKSLSLLIFIYEKNNRTGINKIEENLELFLSNFLTLPETTRELTSLEFINAFIASLRGVVLRLEEYKIGIENLTQNLDNFEKPPLSELLTQED